MTAEEYRRFLMEGTRTGKLATAGAEGQPHVVPIWFVLDGDTLDFTMGTGSAKARHIRRDPHVALCVDDEASPYAFVLLTGTAQTSPNPPDMRAWTTRIAARYIGADRAAAYGRRNAAPDVLLVRLTPTRVIARKGMAD